MNYLSKIEVTKERLMQGWQEWVDKSYQLVSHMIAIKDSPLHILSIVTNNLQLQIVSMLLRAQLLVKLIGGYLEYRWANLRSYLQVINE